MEDVSRRRLLSLGALAAVVPGAGLEVGGQGTGAPASPPVMTASERANADLVTAFCAEWPKHDVAVLMPYLASTISYRITETTPPIVGRDAFRDRIGSIISRMTRIEFAVVETLAKGPIVLNERRDVLVSPDRTRRFHCVGMFFLAGGRIVEWTDYIISQSDDRTPTAAN